MRAEQAAGDEEKSSASETICNELEVAREGLIATLVRPRHSLTTAGERSGTGVCLTIRLLPNQSVPHSVRAYKFGEKSCSSWAKRCTKSCSARNAAGPW
jgi:hypothetical protein